MERTDDHTAGPGTGSVGMYASKLGGRASLLRPDPDDLLTCAHLDVDCITGVVSWPS